MTKLSIRFYQDHEVLAIWYDMRNKWWFSAIDIIKAINDESNHVKADTGKLRVKRELRGLSSNNDGVSIVLCYKWIMARCALNKAFLS